ncbi:MAG: hypothetical protein PHC56_08845, partial [Herbinix sp.]|nr:hypothetical protein [Herbinix sp.]
MSETKGTEEKKNLTTTHKILIIGFASLIVAVGIVGYIIWNNLNKPAPVIVYKAEKIGNYVIDESNFEEIIGDMVKRRDDGMYEVTMNTSWNFSNGTSKSSDAYVANALSNSQPMFFEVFLSDTDELIYTSTVLPVGTKLKELKLDNDLGKGTYPAICKYNLLDE